MMIPTELLIAFLGVLGSLAWIIYRLGTIHADFRRALDVIEDHEDRLRILEGSPKRGMVVQTAQ